MHVTLRSSVRRRGDLAAHIRRIQRALDRPRAVKVGLPAGSAPGDLMDIGFWQHFGTAGGASGGGWGGPIPPRPFVTAAFHANRGEINLRLRRIAIAALRHGTPISSQMPRLGAWAAGLVQGQFGTIGPALSATTIRLKGSSATLIDSGRLRGAVTFRVT